MNERRASATTSRPYDVMRDYMTSSAAISSAENGWFARVYARLLKYSMKYR